MSFSTAKRDNARTGQKVQVPDDLRDLLLEFTISYLLEQPGDIVDYAVQFFTRMQENRNSTMGASAMPSSPEESIISQEEGTY